MKIAYVYDAIHPFETGGVQRRVWELSRRLATDHDVHWYGLKYWDGSPVVEREGVTLHGVMEAPDLYVDGRRSITEALAFSGYLLGSMRGDTFDVIDCQEFPYFPILSSKLAGLRDGSTLIVTWHEIWDDYWYEYLGPKGVCGKAVERLTARLPDVHVAVSEQTRSQLATVGPRDIEQLPNGISMAEIEAAPAVDREIDILFAGRLIEEKNAALLVEAVDQLRKKRPELTCLIVGEGPERDRLETLTEQRGLGDTIAFEAFRESHAEILGLMKAADVLALPSRREGFGITALEAQACGTPVVTVEHPQNAAVELVEDGATGAVCRPTAASLARGLDRTLADSSPDVCRANARAYEWDEITRRTEQLYREAAG